MNDFPQHPDLRITGHEIAFKRHLRLDVYRFHHRLYSGEWSRERVYDVIDRNVDLPIMTVDSSDLDMYTRDGYFSLDFRVSLGGERRRAQIGVKA